MSTAANTLFIKTLGQRIAKIRKMRGYNQFELAERCSKIVNTVSKIERGIGDPRISTLLDIAHALDVSVIDLLNFDKSVFDEEKTTQAQNCLIKSIDGLDEDALSLVSGLIQKLSQKK